MMYNRLRKDVLSIGGLGRTLVSLGWARDFGSLASAGLVVVLIVLPGFALWGAVSSYYSGAAERHATVLSDAFEEARYAVAAEESLERKYRLEPGPEVRAMHQDAARSMVKALERARAFDWSTHELIDAVLAQHALYMAAIDHMFAAIDAGDAAAANRLDSAEVDPTFDELETRVSAAAAASRAIAMRNLDKLTAVQTLVLIATPIVFALGLALVKFFSGKLRSYRMQAGEAALREAAAVRRNEQRFRLLIQNAADVVLICTSSGSISYQSPAAEAAWSYDAHELLERSVIDILHPSEQAAARDLFEQLQRVPGATRNVESRLRDKAGSWRYVELILTNLLHEPAIAGIVVTTHDIDERKAFERQLTQQAFYDALTSLPNRALFQDRLKQAFVRNGRRQNNMAVLFIDLDNFKLVNDGLGHQVGDELLVQAASRLRLCVRAEDTVARLGGDEFVILLEQLDDVADAVSVAETISSQFAEAFTIAGRELVVTASVGIAMGDAAQEQAESLLRNADVAMYRAKALGKGRFVVFDASMHRDTLARLELETDLRRGLEKGELVVHYQPIVPLRSGDITEFEALVRWRHPTRGLVPPAEFIPMAEETGLIVPLGKWVLQEACRQTAAWHATMPEGAPLIVGVNLSPKQFQMANLVEMVAETLRDTGLPASCLKLEITEGAIMHDVEATVVLLSQLKDLGIKLAIDDFGTGYSSLAYLKRLPLDVLKIDRSFIKGIGRDPEDTAIVQAILSLARSLGLTVTAEGIEDAQQAIMLNGWACERGQGYYFAKPLDAAGATALLRTSSPAASLVEAA